MAVAALFGIPLSMMATQSFPFTHDLLGDKDLKPFFAGHWLTKAGEAMFLLPNAVQLIALDADAGGGIRKRSERRLHREIRRRGRRDEKPEEGGRLHRGGL